MSNFTSLLASFYTRFMNSTEMHELQFYGIIGTSLIIVCSSGNLLKAESHFYDLDKRFYVLHFVDAELYCTVCIPLMIGFVYIITFCHVLNC